MYDPRLGWNGNQAGAPKKWLTRILTVLAGATVLAVSLMVSILLFAVVMTVAVIAGARLWWKTRALRRRMREAPPHDPFAAFRQEFGGRIIEGEVVRRPER